MSRGSQMKAQPLVVTVEDGVKTIRITSPTTRNSIGPEFFAAAGHEIAQVSENPEIGAIIFTGAEGFFSSGGNLNMLGEVRSRPATERRQRIIELQQLIQQIRQCPVPVVSAVEGGAAGAGMALALSGDILISSKEAFFAASYVRAGLTPDGGLTALLAEAVPRQLLLELCLTGAHVPAQRLYDLGVVNRLTEAGQAEAVALQLSQHAVHGPKNAIGRILELGRGAYDRSFDRQLELETDLMVESQADDESGEGIAAVLGKRQPQFRR